MYHRRHFSFHSWISCARKNTSLSLSLSREDNWPCITFEALSIREKLSLFSRFFALAVPRPTNIFFGRENELRWPTKGNRKRDSEALQRKKRAAKTYAGCLSRICVYIVYAYVCVHIFTIYTYTYTHHVYVYVCTGGIYRFPLRAKRSTCFTLNRNARYI